MFNFLWRRFIIGCFKQYIRKVEFAFLAIPFNRPIGCPLGRFVIVALVARIWHTVFYTLVRTWYAETMVRPVIVYHIVPSRHVTTLTFCPFTPSFMKMVGFVIEHPVIVTIYA